MYKDEQIKPGLNGVVLTEQDALILLCHLGHTNTFDVLHRQVVEKQGIRGHYRALIAEGPPSEDSSSDNRYRLMFNEHYPAILGAFLLASEGKMPHQFQLTRMRVAGIQDLNAEQVREVAAENVRVLLELS